uniref:CR-type domain-containing protein n=1 Tax=Leersia perrieri TaxID=77586 RepID=A0A0D9WNB3_9ORYZ
MSRLGWIRLASRSLALGYKEAVAQRSKWIWQSTTCSTSGIYIGQHSSPEKDYYKILGVPKDASQDDIKKAFHSLFYRGSEANSTQGGMEFDGAYQDPFSGFHKQGHNPFAEFYRPNNGPFSNKFYKIFSEVFEHDIDVHANDIEVEVAISFREAVKGCMKQVSFSAKNLCNSCDGRGYLANAKTYVCPSCKGAGRVTMYPFTSICTSCRGFGKVIKDYCLTCKGLGVVDGMKYINESILAIQFTYWRLDIVVDVERNLEVASDPLFVRDGADIHVEKRISFTQAMLGGKVEVPSLDGMAEVKIPKGVQPGQVIVLRGKGLPDQAGYLGDQYVRFRIHFPKVVNERQRALLEEFAVEEATKEQNSFAAGNWWELVGNMKGQTFLLGLGFLVLIHLVLTKAVS